MNQSEKLDLFFVDFAKAKSNFKPLEKSGVNEFFKKNGKGTPYSTLDDVLKCCSEALTEAGFILIQGTDITADGKAFLITKLVHKSGQFISSVCPLILGKQDMQGLGSAISYSRRYSIISLLSLADIDDDGNSTASEQPTSNKQNRSTNPVNRSAHTIPGTVPFGKNKGKKLSELPKEVLENDLNYWNERLVSEGKKPTGQLAEYLSAISTYLLSQSTGNPEQPEPGSFDEDINF